MQAARNQGTTDDLLRRLRFPADLERAFRAEYFQKSIELARFVLALAFAMILLVGVEDVSNSTQVSTRLWLLYYCVDCGGLLAAFLFSFTRPFERFMQWAVGAVLLSIGLNMALLYMLFPGRVNELVDLPPVNFIILIMGIYTVSTLRFVPAVLVCWPIVLAYEIAAFHLGMARISDFANNNISLLMANVFGMVACQNRERSLRRDFLLTREIEVERQKSERLLLNVLPPSVAARLKQEPTTIADHFTDVTVLFADIIDFTLLSATISPDALVQLLNEVFSCFDVLAQKHGLEKIKTIGDAYMVVGGLPEPNISHARAVANMALDMQAAITQFASVNGQPLRLRIGIHTGPVVAGVIGRQKFSYDLWGDTVNIASRMEMHCPEGEIQISAETFAHLQPVYGCTPRGSIPVKGRGTIVTYLLKSLPDEPSGQLGSPLTNEI